MADDVMPSCYYWFLPESPHDNILVQQWWRRIKGGDRESRGGIRGLFGWSSGHIIRVGGVDRRQISSSTIVVQFSIRGCLGGTDQSKSAPPTPPPRLDSSKDKAKVSVTVILYHIRSEENFVCQTWVIPPTPPSLWDEDDYIFSASGEDMYLPIELVHLFFCSNKMKTTSSGARWCVMALTLEGGNWEVGVGYMS